MGTGHAAVFVGSTHVLSNSGRRPLRELRAVNRKTNTACVPSAFNRRGGAGDRGGVRRGLTGEAECGLGLSCGVGPSQPD